MSTQKSKSHNITMWIAAVVAVLFGIVTIKSGGQVLFGSDDARLAAGNYIPFVLWFNFTAGFLYVVTGIGIALEKSWSVKAALFLVSATAIVFTAFGLHILLNDVAYETRTVAAMTVRTAVWAAISFVLYRNFKNFNKGVISHEK